MTLCPHAVRAAITSKTSAILPVHFLGVPCDNDALSSIADEHGLWLVYDAAHAFGLTVGDVPVTQWGNASAISLHATKLMHTGEGGAVVMPKQQVNQISRIRNFGLFNGRMVGPGTNAKMSELQAAFGLAVLPQLDGEIAARRQLRERYDALFADIKGLHLHRGGAGANPSMLYYSLKLPSAQRQRLFIALAHERIFARDHFPLLCGTGTALPDAAIVSTASRPVAADVGPQLLSLPFHSGVTNEDSDRIAQIVKREIR